MKPLKHIVTSAVVTSAVVALALAFAAPARADNPRGPSLADEGRGLVYGPSAGFALTLTPQTNIDVPDQPAIQPAWEGLGRFGFELRSGIAIALLIGGGGISASNGGASLQLRALAELRWTIDTDSVRPYFSVAAGYVILRAGSNLRNTFDAMAFAGIDLPLASWVSLEVAVGAEVIFPGDALREVLVLAMLPRVGALFRY